MDLTSALKWVEAAVSTHIGYSLREPEIVILKGTWRGLTYEQMANDSEYSTNYLMRDVAPKLWKQLSNVFGRSVGKTNFRVALEAFATANASMESEIMSSTFSSGVISEYPGAGNAFSGSLSNLLSEANEGWMPEGTPSIAQPTLIQAEAMLLPTSITASPTMYGHGAALQQLKDWFSEVASSEDGGYVIGVWGLEGVGKKLLIKTALSQVAEYFEGIVWCSLRDAPTLDDLSVAILSSLGVVPQAGQNRSQLMAVLSNRQVVLVFEGVEAILQGDSLSGDYRPERRNYSDFFQTLMNSRSCAVLSGIEGPATVIRQASDSEQQRVRSLFY